ncbi:hydroperoxide isomerase ALOXE3 [Eucyclogobius newberryi]|uniref:hydroperoxide isomerase ALOXE3 n=1 Tax=Eucyclogobius newberryi TaxID=166745 RepID=UPI003B58E98F
MLYQVSVWTSPGLTCGSFSHLWLSLIGSEGETPPICVTHGNQRLLPGNSCSVAVPVVSPLGSVLLIRLRLEPQDGFPDLDWHCDRVELRLQEGEELPDGAGPQVFFCHRWIRSSDGDVEIRLEQMLLLSEETEEKLKQHRLREIQLKQKRFRWRVFVGGAPQCLDISSLSELGPELSSSHKSPAVNLQYLRGFSDHAHSWSSFTELDTVFDLNAHGNHTAKLVRDHWSHDWFFGLQTQAGANPLTLKRIRTLPQNLSVTCDMLRPFLPAGSSLQQELQNGHLYLLDYSVLEGVPSNQINGKQTYLSAPLCLLHLSQQGALLPIAIQLQQSPGPLNPVFLPSDSASDWLMAKLWLRLADFQVHQLNSHYLRTHMISELCAVATLRQLPGVHPLHQLLMSHVQTSLQINYQARAVLLNSGGVFDKAIGCGLDALPLVLSRSSSGLTFSSLCVPRDVDERGLSSLPQGVYGHDATRVWSALLRFVIGWLDLCYHGDEDVVQDVELQSWIRDIYDHGFPPESGFPQRFRSKAELSEFVTMVMFSCSALHAAVNFSQLDFALWIPNTPSCLLRPPPQVKGQLTEEDFLSFLPDVNTSVRVLSSLALLSAPAPNFVPLCRYREQLFHSGAPLRLCEALQAELKAISDDITHRNAELRAISDDVTVFPYVYLDPEHIENSVAI